MNHDNDDHDIDYPNSGHCKLNNPTDWFAVVVLLILVALAAGFVEWFAA